jgi:peroxiredoxin
MHALLLLALFQAAPPSSVALRTGCAADDEQIASIALTEPVQVRTALAGDGQTCYHVTLNRTGEKLTGYVLGDSLPAVRAFVHGRELASKAAAEAAARLAPEAEKQAKTDESAKNGEPAKPPDPLVSTQFADFAAKDVNGKLVSLSGLHGKVTLVTFWSPSGSKGDLESLAPIYNGSHAKGLAAIAISTDPRLYKIAEAMDETTLPFPQVPDTIGLAARYHIDRGESKTLVLDANHRIVAAGPMGPDILKAIGQAMKASGNQ